MANKYQKKVSKLTQEAYIKVFKQKMDEERAKCFTNTELKAFADKWEKIISLLEEGWIINPEDI